MMNSILLASRVDGECVLIIESLIFLHAKIIPHYHSLMDIINIIILLLIFNIKKKLHLHVYLIYIHIGECSLISTRQLQLFKYT